MHKDQTSSENKSTNFVNGSKNGRLKASLEDHVQFDRDQAIDQFNSDEKTPRSDLESSSDFDKIKDWVKKNPKKSVSLGALGLFLIGRKRVYRMARLAISTGALTYMFHKIEENKKHV